MFLTKRRIKAQEQRQKEQLIIQFYHTQFNLLSDNYLADPTSENIKVAQRIIQFLDSHSYMFYRSWVKMMSLATIKEQLMQIDQILDQESVKRRNDG